jgi:hypothetical protein
VKIDSECIDLSPVHRFDCKDGASCNYAIAHLWQPPENPEDKSADRGRVFVGNIQTEPLVQLADVR